MSDLADFVSLLAEPGPWTFAYIDASQTGTERAALETQLDRAKAPDADAARLLEAFDAGQPMTEPAARYILVRDGIVIVNAVLAGHRYHSDLVGHDSVPPVLPMLWHSRRLSSAALRRGAASHPQLATGVTEVMEELQRGHVDALVLDIRLWKSEKTLEVLAAEPWVDDRESTEIVGYGPLPVAEALARAALLSGARVIIDEHPDQIARSARAALPPQAVLRSHAERPMFAAAA